jgi:hypothetical protein
MNKEFLKFSSFASMLLASSVWAADLTGPCKNKCNGLDGQTCTAITNSRGQNLAGKETDTLLDQPRTTFDEYWKASTTTTRYRWFSTPFYCSTASPSNCTTSWTTGWETSWAAGVGASFIAGTLPAQASVNGMLQYTTTKNGTITNSWEVAKGKSTVAAQYITRVQVKRKYNNGWIWDQKLTTCGIFNCYVTHYWCPANGTLANVQYNKYNSGVAHTNLYWNGNGANPNKITN